MIVDEKDVEPVHMERAEALRKYAYENGLRVPSIRAIILRADKVGGGNRTKGFDCLDNGTPLY